MTKLTRAEVMNRASFLRSNGKMILKFDLSGLESIEEVKKVVKYFSTSQIHRPNINTDHQHPDFESKPSRRCVLRQLIVKSGKFC